MLHMEEIPEDETSLPSPEDLSGYILVKVIWVFVDRSFYCLTILVIVKTDIDWFMWLNTFVLDQTGRAIHFVLWIMLFHLIAVTNHQGRP